MNEHMNNKDGSFFEGSYYVIKKFELSITSSIIHISGGTYPTLLDAINPTSQTLIYKWRDANV
jgi:hypothetical protein